jgi:hypothetical protein
LDPSDPSKNGRKVKAIALLFGSFLSLFQKFEKSAKNGRKVKAIGPHRPNAIRQRDANFQFLKTNKTING